jgi:hypothetical protein
VFVGYCSCRDFFDITTALFFVCVESKSTGTGISTQQMNEKDKRELFVYLLKNYCLVPSSTSCQQLLLLLLLLIS